MCGSHFLLRVVCMVGCMTSLMSSSNDDLAQEIIEHVLRIPNHDKMLNRVLGRLERSGELVKDSLAYSEETDCEEPNERIPEYTETLDYSRERELRQLGPQKHYPICHMERKIRRLNTNEYEYRPAYYEEIRCIAASRADEASANEICSSLGFSCVQWNKTIHLTRRLYTSDCWESKTLVIPAGCECMWPVHRLGDISLHVRVP